MGKVIVVTLGGRETRVFDNSLGNVVDANNDNAIDFFMVWEQPPQGGPKTEPRVGLKEKDSKYRDTFCQKDTRRVFVTNPKFQQKAGLFAGEWPMCTAKIVPKVGEKDNSKAKTVFLEGKKRATKLYADFVKALEKGVVEEEREDADGKGKFKVCDRFHFIDSRGRKISGFSQFEGSTLEAINLDDDHSKEECKPGKKCQQNVELYNIGVDITDPKLVQPIAKYFNAPIER